jgi:hypothetical protein
MSSPQDPARVRKRSAAAAARRASINRNQVILPGDTLDDPEEPAAPPASQAGPSAPERPAAPASRGRAANLSLLREQRHSEAGDRPATFADRRPGRGGLALPQADLSRQIDTGDLIIPRLKISQGLSKINMLHAQSRGKEGVQMGNWYVTTSGQDLGEVVYFVPCDMRKSRSMFEQGRGLVCRSFDLLRGEGDPGILCEGTAEEIQIYSEDERGCSYRNWTTAEDGSRTPPPCGITYNYPGFIVGDVENPEETPLTQAMLQLRSMSTAAARSINTQFTVHGDGEWHRLLLELRVEPKSNRRGTFFVAVADLYGTLEGPEWERVAKRTAMFARSVGAADLRSSMVDDGD